MPSPIHIRIQQGSAEILQLWRYNKETRALSLASNSISSAVFSRNRVPDQARFWLGSRDNTSQRCTGCKCPAKMGQCLSACTSFLVMASTFRPIYPCRAVPRLANLVDLTRPNQDLIIDTHTLSSLEGSSQRILTGSSHASQSFFSYPSVALALSPSFPFPRPVTRSASHFSSCESRSFPKRAAG